MSSDALQAACPSLAAHSILHFTGKTMALPEGPGADPDIKLFQKAVYLYTVESFWYRALNAAMLARDESKTHLVQCPHCSQASSRCTRPVLHRVVRRGVPFA